MKKIQENKIESSDITEGIDYTKQVYYVKEEKKSIYDLMFKSSEEKVIDNEHQILISLNDRNNNSIHPKLRNFSIQNSKLLKSFYGFDVFIAKSQSLVYNFNNSKQKLLKNLENILHFAFHSMKAIISRPVLEITSRKIIIHLFFFFKNLNSRFGSRKTKRSLKLSKKRNQKKYYSFYNKKYNKINFKFDRNSYNFLNRNLLILKLLTNILSNYLKKSVEFELIRLHYPINESFILAKSIGKLGNKIRRRFKYFVNASFKSAKIDNPNNYKGKLINSFKHNASSSITGISMKLGGRILAQKIVPRFTSQTFQEGSLNRGITNIVNTSRFTSKNRKGSYSITVSMGHRFF